MAIPTRIRYDQYNAISSKISRIQRSNKTNQRWQLSLSFPKDTDIEPILDFESEFIQLAAWLDVRFDEFNKIQEISTEINKGSVLDDVLNRIYDTFHIIIPYDRIGYALISDDHEKL